MMPGRTRTLFLLLIACAVSLGLLGCRRGVTLVLLTPTHGEFTTAASIVVSGDVNGNLGIVDDVLVNGVSVLPLNPDGTFSVNVTLDPLADFHPFHPIKVEMLRSGGIPQVERVTVIAGESVADGDYSPMAVALRLNDSGLDQIEPEITSLVNLDLATLLPPGTLVIDNFCYQDSFLGCLGRVDVLIHGSPPPSIGSFSIDVDSQTNFAEGDIRLNNLALTARVVAVTGIGFTCYIDIAAATTDIFGDYGLDPSAIDPSNIDVSQIGGVNVVFGGFSDSTDCEGFLGFIVEALVSLFVGDVQDLMRPAFEDFLNTVDASGNTPVAGAIEDALAQIELSGPIGQAIGVNLETPLFSVDEDVQGITLDSDARITASLPDPNAVDLLASYHVPEVFPSFGATTPVGGLPYGMAIGISTSGFNQLLKAEVESGLLLASITELDLFGTGTQPLTAGFLAPILPGFANLDPALPIRIDIQPTLGAIVSGDDGPLGELAELRVGQIEGRLVEEALGQTLISFAVDAKLGLDMTFADGSLSFDLGTLTSQDIGVDILVNQFLIPTQGLENLLLFLLPTVLPQLADSLGTFPLPDFLGLQLDLVEISKNGEYMSLFVNLSPGP